jgi:hypothetical protein
MLSWHVNAKKRARDPPIDNPDDVADLPTHQGDRILSTAPADASSSMRLSPLSP